MKRCHDGIGQAPQGRADEGLTRRQALLGGGGLLGLSALGSLAFPGQASGAPRPASDPFVYCLNTGTIRGQKLGIVKEAEVASQAGFQAIEPWVSDLDQFRKGGGSLKELRRRLGDLGLVVASAITFPQWIAEDRAAREKGLEQAKRDMDLVAQVGGTRMATPPAGATNEPALALPQVAERYRQLLQAGDQVGVLPLLELWGFSATLHRLGEVAYVLAECGHPKAAAVLDTFHIYKGGSEFTGLRLFNADTLPVFHVNDYPANPPRDQVGDGDRVMPGDGAAPTTEILRMLASGTAPRVLSLELFNRDYWSQDALEVARIGLAKMQAAAARVAS